MATINVYQGSTKKATTTVEGLTSLDGYTAYLLVEDVDGVEQFEVEGAIDGLDIVFSTTPANNDLDANTRYLYEAYITNGTNVYPLDEGIWLVHKTLKDHTA